MAEVIARVVDQNMAPQRDVKVTFDYNILGIPYHIEKITDTQGEAKIDVGATSADVIIKATKYPYAGETRCQVGIFGIGVTPPNPQIITFQFKPTAPIQNAIEDITKSLGDNAKIVIIAVGIPAGLLATYLIYRWVTTGQFIGTASKVGSAAKGAIGGALKK